MAKVNLHDIKKTDLKIVAGDSIKNAPIGTVGNSHSEPLDVDISNLEEVNARIIGGADITYSDNNFQTALYILYRRISSNTTDNQKVDEVKQIVDELQAEKGKDQFDIVKVKGLIGKLQTIVTLINLAPAVMENVKQLISGIAKTFGLG